MNVIKNIYALYQKRKRKKFFDELERLGMKIGYEIEPCGKSQTFKWLGNNNDKIEVRSNYDENNIS